MTQGVDPEEEEDDVINRIRKVKKKLWREDDFRFEHVEFRVRHLK